MRRRVLCPLRCEKYAQTLRLQRPYRCSRFQAPIAPKPNVRNLDPVELDAQRRRCLSSTRWTPAQSHDMTPVVDADAIGVNLAQVGPPNDEGVGDADHKEGRVTLHQAIGQGCARPGRIERQGANLVEPQDALREAPRQCLTARAEYAIVCNYERPRAGPCRRMRRSLRQASAAPAKGWSSPLSTISSSAAVRTASSPSSTSQISCSFRCRRSIS